MQSKQKRQESVVVDRPLSPLRLRPRRTRNDRDVAGDFAEKAPRTSRSLSAEDSEKQKARASRCIGLEERSGRHQPCRLWRRSSTCRNQIKKVVALTGREDLLNVRGLGRGVAAELGLWDRVLMGVRA